MSWDFCCNRSSRSESERGSGPCLFLLAHLCVFLSVQRYCRLEKPMLPPANRDSAAKSRAAAAAAVAAASVTPGQRDRAIQEAALAALKARETAAAASNQADSQSPAAAEAANGSEQQPSDSSAASAANPSSEAATPVGYEPPEWSGAPEGVPYGLEVLKNGTLVENKDLSTQPYYTFGRSPTADMLLEHPSASRLHAVLQFDGSSKEAFLYDCGSTHGTFLNKNRLKARVHAPLRVGDTFRFGQSSRMYVLTGPEELMPQEGLSKQQKKQLALLEAAQARKEADEAKARAQMEAALAGSAADGVNWGMAGDDADFEAQAAADNVNWRTYVDNHKLTDRQTKLLDKIRKREYKIKNLEAECAKIAAKERSEGGLTQGQASTLVRNERALEAIREELEELEEQLTDSITDSIKGKQTAKDSKEHQQSKKRKHQPGSDDEYAAASDSEDEFYDRTVAAGPNKAAAGKDKAAAKRAKGEPAKVENAETLYAKRSALLEEKQRLEADIAAEQKLLDKQQQQQQQATQQQHTAIEDNPQQQGMQQVVQQVDAAASSAAAEGVAAAAEEGVDSLDAFMNDVTQNLEVDKLTSLKRELDSIEQQIQRTERLIHIADPDGWYNPNKAGGSSNAAASKAAADAKAAVKAALEAERQRRAEAVAKQRAGWAAAQAAVEAPAEQEEEEDERDQAIPDTDTAAAAGTTGADSSKSKKAVPVVIKPKGLLATKQSQQEAAVSHSAGSSRGKAAAAEEAAQQLMKEFAQPAAITAKKALKGPTMPPPGFKAPAAKAAASGSNVSATAAARVAASIAILTSHSVPLAADVEDAAEQQQQRDVGVDDAGGWVPPADQTGDGKTSLNAKYGY